MEYVPGLQGVPATESAVSDLDGLAGELRYRGYPIAELAMNSTFEETAFLLLHGELPNVAELTRFDSALRKNRRVKYQIREILKFVPQQARVMEMLQTAVSVLGMFYPGDERLTDPEAPDGRYIDEMTVKLIARMPTLVAMWAHLRSGYDPIPPRQDMTYAENFLYMLHGQEPEPFLSRIMDALLILHAEHTINASTFTTRVVGSTLAAPHLVVAAAIGALAGPLHGGANQRVLAMLREIGRPERVEAWLEETLARKGKVWGFGHREYKVKDPRATILQRLLMELKEQRCGRVDPLFDVAMRLEAVAAERLGSKGVYPNVDYFSSLVYIELGVPEDMFTAIFAMARTVGWLAHWREQLGNNRIYRPTQLYVGADTRRYAGVSALDRPCTLREDAYLGIRD